MKLELLIFGEHIAPATKAGGIVTSLENLCLVLSGKVKIGIVGSNRDLDGGELNVVTDKWLKQSNNCLYRRYSSVYKVAFCMIKVETVFINGLFSIWFNLLPVLWYSVFRKSKIVLSPRGMISLNALCNGSFKKKVYLRILKGILSKKRSIIHATSPQEVKDVKRIFNGYNYVQVADSPDPLNKEITNLSKTKGSARLVYVGRIVPHKNLLFALKIFLNSFNENVEFDIYGPIEDEVYWRKCERIIKLKSYINYKGVIPTENVHQVMQGYHALIMPSLSENFGHVIYGALNQGRPVLIGQNTPWENLEEVIAGWDLPLDRIQEWKEKVSFIIDMNQKDYNLWCKGAKGLVDRFWSKNNLEQEYLKLFKG